MGGSGNSDGRGMVETWSWSKEKCGDDKEDDGGLATIKMVGVAMMPMEMWWWGCGGNSGSGDGGGIVAAIVVVHIKLQHLFLFLSKF